MIKSAIVSFGSATPAYQHAQDAQAELIAAGMQLSPAEKRLLKTVYKSTGIQTRYSVLGSYNSPEENFEIFPEDSQQSQPSTAARMQIYKKYALPLALKAVQNNFNNLTDHNINPQDITHIITVSCTGMYAPGLDIELIQQLGLNTQIKRTAVNFMGCYGAFNALKLADSICQADPKALVLIISVELCTIHFQKSLNLDNIIANAIFADGAAAVFIQAVSPEAQKKAFVLSANYCELLPQTDQAMAWSIANNGFDIVLSSYVPDIILSGINQFCQNLLTQNNLNLNNIDFFAIHPGGIKILQACEKALNITKAQNLYSYEILKNYGNMSSATVLFVLKHIWDNISSVDHDKNIFSCAFGPGLTLESMLFKISCHV